MGRSQRFLVPPGVRGHAPLGLAAADAPAINAATARPPATGGAMATTIDWMYHRKG